MTEHSKMSCREGFDNSGYNECPACTQLAIQKRDLLIALVARVHTAKGRYHMQQAMCDLFDAVGLSNERPKK